MTQPEKSPSPPPAAELLLADVVELCEQPVCRLRGDGTVLALNPAFTLLTGWAEGEVVGEPLAARLHPGDAAPLGRCLVSLAAGAGARATVHLRLHQGGEAYGTVVFSAARRGEDVLLMGRGLGAAGGARQVGAGALGTWSYDVCQDLLCWSAVTRQHFGLAAHVPVSLELFSSLVHPDDREQVTHAFKTAVAGGGTFKFEYRVHAGDGVERVIAARGQAFAAAHGRAAWFDGTTVDVTEAKQSQRALTRALQVRDNFLAIASHELRTPLTGTLLQLNLLERRLGRGRDRDRQVVDTFIGHLHVQIDRLVRLVDEIIDISRISSDSLRIAPRRIDLARLIHDVGDAQRGHLRRAGCELHIDVCERLWAYADGDRLAQALVNVLDNAARHAPHSPVRVRVHAAQGLAAIEIIDGGGGISAEDQERIFGKFERAVSRHERSGLGLGLTISRHILRAHQGDLMVTSALGAGATFTMTLPMAA